MVLSNFKMKMTMIVLAISFSQNAYQTITSASWICEECQEIKLCETCMSYSI